MKIDKEAQEYYAQLTAFYQQFRRIGNNYSQCVKTIHTIYGEKKSLAFLYKLAEETRKPLIIHCVGRYGLLTDLHRELRPTQPWIIHGFTGKPELARQLVAEGFFFSLRPDSPVRQYGVIPENRLFTESD